MDNTFSSEPNCPVAQLLQFFHYYFLTQKHKGITATFILFWLFHLRKSSTDPTDNFKL
jgi:hypothetical protein